MFIEYLKDEYDRRRRRNPSYSLRAFAKNLGMDSSTFSALLGERRVLTVRTAQRILRELKVDPVLKIRLLDSVIDPVLDRMVPGQAYVVLPEERFEPLSDWEYFAILSVLQLHRSVHTAHWIARRLGIEVDRAAFCVSRLERVGILRKETHRKRPRWQVCEKALASTTDIPSRAVRKQNLQYIQMAERALSLPVECRDITGMTMPVSQRKIRRAKEMITKFRRQLCDYLEAGEKDSVYRLNIQLFPLTR